MSVFKTGKAALIIALMCAGSCVERNLTIVTEPSDAVVWLNDEEIGTSPVTVGFNWYGNYKVRVEKSGYEILNTHRDLPAPVYDHFPLDFFAEYLWPGTIVDEYTWTFALDPAVLPDSQTLLKKSEEFRTDAEEELEQSQSRARELLN